MNRHDLKRYACLSGVACAILTVAGCSGIPSADSDVPTSRNTISTSDLKYSSMEEWVGALVQCMHDAGWSNVVATEVNWGIQDDTVTKEQMGAFNQSRFECEAQVGVAPNELPLTDDQIRIVYHHWVKQKECLEDLGYEISAPPSEDTFVAQAKADKVGAGWSPFAQITPMEGDLDEVFQQCPQMPPGM